MATPIENNTEGLQRILNAVNNLPEADSGVTVQVKTGTVTGVSGMEKTVNCNFKPDVVFFTGESPFNDETFQAGVAFTAEKVTTGNTLFISASTSYIYTAITVKQNSTGFSVSGVRLTISGESQNESNRSLNYIAIKYTE